MQFSAIDERYITRALEKHYQGVLSRKGRPSGIDYLEKIIQLPYRVRPIAASAFETYLRAQVVIQDSATKGAKFSEFTPAEFQMLLNCCRYIDLSPRTLKRLTNVYKLFKIVSRTRGSKLSPETQQATLALLALSGRYPELMRGIFDQIQTCYEENQDFKKALLHQFFEAYQLDSRDSYLKLEFARLEYDALKTNLMAGLTLADLTYEVFDLIRSFSFVGEIGYNSEDYRTDGSLNNEQEPNGKVPNPDSTESGS